MNAIDILGSLLGHKSSATGRGTDILKDILKRGSRDVTHSPSTSSGSTSSGSTKARPDDIEREAQELEVLLNVANERQARRRTEPPRPPQAQQSPRADARLAPGSRPTDTRTDQRLGRGQSDAGNLQEEQALVLVRAMVNAAKSDGQIDPAEQQRILERLGEASREAIAFLREEFAKPLDVREFAWSVPLGMEQQVYTLSLIAIDLNNRSEANYLLELAHGLRIPGAVREQIHRRLGAPSI